MGQTPEELRLRYLYRRLVLSGKVPLPLAAARMLIGPDCAYHLYGAMKNLGEAKATAGPPCAEAPADEAPIQVRKALPLP